MTDPKLFATVTSLTNSDRDETRFRDGMLEVPGVLHLHHGGTISGVRMAWRLSGPDNAPVIVALGGISADRRVTAGAPGERGWWQDVVKPGGALPADRYRILAFDYLGGSGETTGPEIGVAFPAVSSYDQADLLLRLINHLGVKTLQAFVGASYGGMVGLAFAERYPGRLARLCVISAADKTHPMASAWRSVQRGIVRFGIAQGAPSEGLKLARALGMSTYRSPEELAARFDARPQLEGGRYVFPVEQYLFARGEDFVTRHRPEAFLALSESIDLHRIDAARVFVPTAAVAIREDQLVPLGDMRAMVARLPNAQLIELSSIYGHDAFLKESEQLTAVFERVLESPKR